MVPMPKFTFYAEGDRRITAKHPTTLEITKEGVKSSRGDCIVATKSSIGLADLPKAVKEALRKEGAEVVLTIESQGIRETVRGKGSPLLTLESESEMVARRSRYVCGRTLMICADKAASDLRRDLVEALAREGARVTITLEVT